MSAECRYPCGCEQFPEEHCSCMDGHRVSKAPADVEVLAEEFYLAVMQATDDQWAEWQHAPQSVRSGYYDLAYEVAEKVRWVIAQRIEGLCVLGSDNPLAVVAECSRLVREGE